MSKSIREAMQFVADHPRQGSKDPLDMPVWELVSRSLFDIANSPDVSVRGSLARATAAQKIILDRLVGTRRTGSAPVVLKNTALDFVDLTAGALDE